jgi:putative oxidoreductase
MDGLWAAAEWIGRILFCALFLSSGLAHLTQRQGMTAYAQSKGVPGAGSAVVFTGLMQLAGALMILFNWHAVLGCFLLVVFLIPTAFMMHNFWTLSDPMQKAGDRAHFFKDLALAGAAMIYAVMLHRAGVGL